jgi:cell division protein FtsW (lipid II flippase)
MTEPIVLKVNNERNLILLVAIVLSTVSVSVLAQSHDEDESQDYEVLGFELEKLIALVNAWLALFLFVVTFIAYKRDKRKRLFYVSLAFLLFSIKSFMLASELFFPEIEWFDPTSKALEFFMILSFFYGVIKK